MSEDEKQKQVTVERSKVDETVVKLTDQGYLVTGVKDVTVGGQTRKQISAKHKNAAQRPGLAFDD